MEEVNFEEIIDSNYCNTDYDPVFESVAQAIYLENIGYEDGLSLIDSMQSVDWDRFILEYKQYRAIQNKKAKDTRRQKLGIPTYCEQTRREKRQRRRLKEKKENTKSYYAIKLLFNT